MENKKFWESKTIWINALALMAMIVQLQWGFIVDPEFQLALLAIVGLFIRFKTDVKVVK